MRIEILVGNSEEPLIFPLNKPKLTLGSGETCDIIVDAPNISRKHVQILCEGDNFFVVDQGSTNGTFINEERLVPGRRTEFTSFFPVRLGDLVLITLLSDEEMEDEPPSTLSFPDAKTPTGISATSRSSDESTQMISLGDLRKAKTADLVNRRKEIVKKKTVQASPNKKAGPKSKRAADKSWMQKIQLMVVLLVGAAAYVNFYVFERKVDNTAKMGEEIPLDPAAVKAAKAAAEEVKVAEVPLVIPDGELPPREKVENLLTDIKCTLDIEKYFCSTIYKNNEGEFGTVQVGTVMYVLSDGQFFYDEAKKMLPPPVAMSPDGQLTPEELAAHEVQVKRVMSVIFLLRAIPPGFDFELTKDYKFAFGLFTKNEEGVYKLNTVVAVLPASLKEFQRLFQEVHLSNVKQIGLSAIEFVSKYYRYY
ncbi:MAG: FHA domain-containing protein [Bdellovibrionota bacterium]